MEAYAIGYDSNDEDIKCAFKLHIINNDGKKEVDCSSDDRLTDE